MENIETQPLGTEQERQTAARCRLYNLFAEVFRYPDETFRTQVRKGELEKTFQALLNELPYPFALSPEESGALRLPDSMKDEDLEVEFVRLFEAGPGGPPCALVESAYCEDRKVVFKEIILFYNHFGLSYAEGEQDERPDHLCLEMEFLHWLTFEEVHALQTEVDPAACRRGQRDFLERHLLVWVTKLDERLDLIVEKLPEEEVCREAVSLYRGLVKLLQRFLEQELLYLKALLAK